MRVDRLWTVGYTGGISAVMVRFLWEKRPGGSESARVGVVLPGVHQGPVLGPPVVC